MGKDEDNAMQDNSDRNCAPFSKYTKEVPAASRFDWGDAKSNWDVHWIIPHNTSIKINQVSSDIDISANEYFIPVCWTFITTSSEGILRKNHLDVKYNLNPEC